MNLSSARATFGLFATASHTSIGVVGDAQIGTPNTPIRFDDANVIYQLRTIFSNAGDILELDMGTSATTGSTAFVAGYPQVERATAVGTITTAGNATVIVTAAGMTGSPRTVTFAVALSDTAAMWAAKARAALAADSTIGEKFHVVGTGTAIELGGKGVFFPAPQLGHGAIYPANDTSLNIALADATSAGITEAATSANITTGIATDGCEIWDGDGKDFEGVTITGIGTVYGFLLQAEGSSTVFDGAGTDAFTLMDGEILIRAGAGGIGSNTVFTVTASGPAALTITVIGTDV